MRSTYSVVAATQRPVCGRVRYAADVPQPFSQRDAIQRPQRRRRRPTAVVGRSTLTMMMLVITRTWSSRDRGRAAVSGRSDATAAAAVAWLPVRPTMFVD